jgi:hypothetical protein
LKEVKKPSVRPIYGAGAVFCICCLVLPVYRWWGLLVALVLAVVAFAGLTKLFPGETITVAQPEPEPDTGNAQLDETIRAGRAYLSQIRQLNDAIADEKLTAQLSEMEDLCRKIFAQVEQRPDKLPQLRKFLNYYLPTTLKLLQSYEKLSSQGVRGQNIDQSLTAIQALMDKIIVAFRSQLDSLFAADSMDITAEIAVMEQMMAAEGLTGPKL